MKGFVRTSQAKKLLHNKFVVILGGSVQRSMYKDLVQLLHTDRYLTLPQLKSKGEHSFKNDRLVEGGCLGAMTNGTDYREVRQYHSDHHLLRFYFITRVYSPYMQTILEDFRQGLKPDLLIVSSCVWDMTRYGLNCLEKYKENLHKFFGQIKTVLSQDCLFIWTLAMPLAKQIKGGFLVPEVSHLGPSLCSDIIEANFFGGGLAHAYGLDTLDLHFHFRLSLQHRMPDGVHWDALAHRRISSLLLVHAAQAWGVVLEEESSTAALLPLPLPPPPPPLTTTTTTTAPAAPAEPDQDSSPGESLRKRKKRKKSQKRHQAVRTWFPPPTPSLMGPGPGYGPWAFPPGPPHGPLLHRPPEDLRRECECWKGDMCRTGPLCRSSRCSVAGLITAEKTVDFQLGVVSYCAHFCGPWQHFPGPGFAVPRFLLPRRRMLPPPPHAFSCPPPDWGPGRGVWPGGGCVRWRRPNYRMHPYYPPPGPPAHRRPMWGCGLMWPLRLVLLLLWLISIPPGAWSPIPIFNYIP